MSEKITYQVRVDKNIRDEFLTACKKNGDNCAALVRAFMVSYIKLKKQEKSKKFTVKTIAFGLDEN